MSEHVVEGIIGASYLQQLVDTHTPLVNECKMHFHEGGISVRVVDPANVAMALTDLGTEAFESYDCPGSAVVGVNLNALDDRLGLANSGDLIHFSLDMETRRLKLRVRNINQHAALIDPDALRSEPDLPDLNLPNWHTITGGDLAEAVAAADMVSDHISIRGDPDEGLVSYEAEGDTDESYVEYGDEEVIASNVPEEAASLYSLDYLDEIATPIPDDSEVEIKFGDDHPMILEYECSEGAQSTTNFLAPRVQSR